MSEQKQSFMQQLDAWTDEVIIAPLFREGPEIAEEIREAIRDKVLQSYRNGQAAGPSKWREKGDHGKERSYAQAKSR
jgi:hypothetical protein